MSSPDVTWGCGGERPLRRDAERNRRRILEAAREVFAERGLGVTMDDIADHADVGVGTVYRRFPEKEALIEALFEERVEELVSLAQEAMAEDDPWDALVGFLERGQALQASNRGLKELVLSTGYGRERVACMRDRMAPLVHGLVERAQASGQLRPDIVGTDLPLIQVMLGGIVDFTRDVDPDTWRRMLAIIVDGLRAREPLTPLEAPALDPSQVEQAMHGWKPLRC
ncbi:MAG: regulatory protein TetR [Solirubrobacterales bacterium]|nr:regulatory protein TetR [Solirubrobacterales bacterium]